ncbi:hypothetical protein DSO57_1005758 [Entomophthora muscae]|uniref:Uncharacterized protein n=1 Tax=Entomophthora muscae TaxID=34485 RepID=A0ACC2U627_9FUNG|nr:hypothetical protein DSO57_1005758 [Entomophthora muscae]
MNAISHQSTVFPHFEAENSMPFTDNRPAKDTDAEEDDQGWSASDAFLAFGLIYALLL